MRAADERREFLVTNGTDLSAVNNQERDCSRRKFKKSSYVDGTDWIRDYILPILSTYVSMRKINVESLGEDGGASRYVKIIEIFCDSSLKISLELFLSDMNIFNERETQI